MIQEDDWICVDDELEGLEGRGATLIGRGCWCLQGLCHPSYWLRWWVQW